ncbi:MAG: ABC transporter ATP-binding protein, partial [Butyricicoccus sp.]|nr:ABC transporter ATP-binding protein [Butyricicoccus sp.]
MKISVFHRLGHVLRAHTARLVRIMILLVLANVAALSAPLLSGQAMDAVGLTTGGVDFRGVLLNCAGMAVCYGTAAILQYIVSAQLLRVGQEISHELRTAAFTRVSELPVRWFDTHPSGDLISRISYDVDTVNAMLSTDLLQIATSLLTVVVSFVMLLTISVRLSVIFFITVPLSTLLTRIQMKRLQP